MKVGGTKTKPMEEEDLSMPMEMFMMVYGSMIRLMDLVSIAISMVPSMKVNGRRTNNMEKVWKLGQMEQSIRDNT